MAQGLPWSSATEDNERFLQFEKPVAEKIRTAAHFLPK